MKILVANFGSTSFKYRLFSMESGTEVMLAKGGYERVTDYAATVEDALATLIREGQLETVEELDAVGFKTVLGKHLSGCVECDDGRVLEALDGFTRLAPAHNPPYAEGICTFERLYPAVRRFALFETAFYQWVPDAAQVYAVPLAWRRAGLQRYGFHGASHKFVAERGAELLGREDVAVRVRGLYQKGPGTLDGPPLRTISCHLGGSSSVTGVDSGVAIGTSMGLTPQSGLPQNNRVGDLDSGAFPFLSETLGLTADEIMQDLTRSSGLLGLSGVSNDMRDIHEAADAGNAHAELARRHLVHAIRHYIGAYLLHMGGLDALLFTAGIGERDPWVRAEVCKGLEGLGLKLDPQRNETILGQEGRISADDSNIHVWVIPTNEELVVARETYRNLISTTPSS